MDTTKTTHISLCTGYGGIDLGLRRAIPNLQTVAYAEIEAFACENLLARMEGGQLDAAPIWSDLKSFPWKEFSGLVDILSGGYPCQPFSAAGKRLGTEDPRHLWPYIAAGIRLLQPRLCFFENVEGHISLGLSDVIEDLAGMGYRTTWGIFSASECGAPHQRKRVFILAHRCDTGLQGTEWLRETGTERPPIGHTSECNGSVAVASGLGGAAGLSGQITGNEGQPGESDDGGYQAVWPSRPGEQQYGWEPPRVVSGRQALDDTQERCLRDDSDNQRQTVGEGDTANDSGSCSGEAGEELGDARCERQEERQLPSGWSEQSDQNMADTSIIGSDGRPDGISWGSREPREAGEDVAGCRGESNGMRQTQPALGGDADGAASGLDYAQLCISCDNRTDELRLLGNGVVPATAERAFRTLIAELFPHEITIDPAPSRKGEQAPTHQQENL